jgi:hypothetical protein
MTSPGDVGRARERTASLIARFGDVPIVVGPLEESAAAVARRSGAAETADNAIHLPGPGPYRVVVQKGRSFQRANPNVPVVVDRGRYLVVELSPDVEVRQHPGAFTVTDPEAGPIGFEVERAAPVARRADISAALARITEADLRAKVVTLAGLHTRHSLLPRLDAAIALASGWLRDDANCQIERVELPIPGGRTANLIGRRSGTAPDASRSLFVLCAHLDSVNHDGGLDDAAPGADDNASGSATVAAIATAVANEVLQHDVHFVFFGGEEQGLFGSLHYVRNLSPADRARVAGVINIDMAAVKNTPTPTVLLEGANVSRHVITALAQAAATFTSLTTQTSLNPFNSDHVPFIDRGMPAVLTIEGTDEANPHEHTERDTPDRLNFALHREITIMNLAWLLEQAR